MATRILILTPDVALGQRICQMLDDSGRYHTVLATTLETVRQLPDTDTFALGIFIGEAKEALSAQWGSALRESQPSLRVVTFPADEASTHLLEVLDGSLALGVFPNMPPLPLDLPADNASPAPDWLQDVTRAAQHLATLSLESSAQAALILRDGDLWAYAGQLPQPAAQELAATISHHWAKGSGRDLARFVSLGETAGDYMLYATRLIGDLVLALAFDVETPFSKMRSQAGQLARALANPPSAKGERPAAPPSPRNELPEADADIPSLSSLLDDIPPPTVNAPPGKPRTLPRTPPVFEPEETVETPPPAPLEPVNAEPAPHAPLPAVAEAKPLEETLPAEFERIQSPRTAVSPLDETRPNPLKAPSGQVELQPASPAVCGLYYACMLIPRLPQHHLTGDLAEQLSHWMEQLCLAFGWRLEHLAIRPDYLQWIVSVNPTTSPSYIMRIIRQHTSQYIFAQHPALGRDNPSGDFWAPGYLIMSTSQPPPAQVVKDFIQHTRRQQGASTPKRHS